MTQFAASPLSIFFANRLPAFRRGIACGAAALLLLCAAGLSAQEDEDGFVLKAGEGMRILVPLDTAAVLNGEYSIDTAGYVDLPVAGRMFVHNKPAEEVAESLSKSMSQYMRDTHVMITPVIRLAMLGNWQKPGMYYVKSDATVWEACLAAGAPVGEKKLYEWKVVRGTQVMPTVLVDEFSRGTTLRGAGIKSGDIFVIPIPDPNSGFWYWFRESLTVTAQIATIATTALTAYLTYLILEDRSDNDPLPSAP